MLSGSFKLTSVIHKEGKKMENIKLPKMFFFKISQMFAFLLKLKRLTSSVIKKESLRTRTSAHLSHVKGCE